MMLKMSYYFTNPGWLDGGAKQSFINFTLYDIEDSPTGSSSQDFPG